MNENVRYFEISRYESLDSSQGYFVKFEIVENSDHENPGLYFYCRLCWEHMSQKSITGCQAVFFEKEIRVLPSCSITHCAKTQFLVQKFNFLTLTWIDANMILVCRLG